MKRKAFLVCAIALAAALFATAAEADRRVALVIGNSAYRNATQLPNTINDANAVAALFRSVGFEVVNSRTDLGVLDFKRAVRDFLITATRLRANSASTPPAAGERGPIGLQKVWTSRAPPPRKVQGPAGLLIRRERRTGRPEKLVHQEVRWSGYLNRFSASISRVLSQNGRSAVDVRFVMQNNIQQ
jgi:Caspase domain